MKKEGKLKKKYLIANNGLRSFIIEISPDFDFLSDYNKKQVEDYIWKRLQEKGGFPIKEIKILYL